MTNDLVHVILGSGWPGPLRCRSACYQDDSHVYRPLCFRTLLATTLGQSRVQADTPNLGFGLPTFSVRP